jgi:hypothetical protein
MTKIPSCIESWYRPERQREWVIAVTQEFPSSINVPVTVSTYPCKQQMTSTQINDWRHVHACATAYDRIAITINT